MKRILLVVLTTAYLLALIPFAAFAAQDLPVYFNGTQISYSNKPYYDGEALMIPFKETVQGFGITVDYTEENETYSAVINDYEISMRKGTNEVSYDLIPFELSHECKLAEDDIYLEATFFDTVYGFSVKEDTHGFYISGEIIPKSTFDVEAYLESQPNKTYVISPPSLFESVISSPKLIAKREVEITDLPGITRGIELDNLTEPDIYYSTQVTMTCESPMNEGDIVVAEFWAKKIMCIDESGLSTFNVVLETLDGKYTKYINKTDTVSGEWTHFRYAFKIPSEVPDKGAQVGFRVGFRLQTIQLADMSFINYGPALDMDKLGGGTFTTSDYHGMEEDALWREEAFKRIEKHRVRDINVEAVDADGNPVSGVNVKADMTKSEFIWGTAADYREMFSGRANANTFRKILLENFNSLVLENGMKTGTWDMKMVTDTLNYAANNDLYVRAHAVLWDNIKYFPDVDITQLTEKEAFDYICRHASRILYNVGPAIDEIDAINEALNNNYLQKKYGRQFAANVLKAVQDMIDDVNPEIDIFVNDIMCGLHSNWNNFIQCANMVKEYMELGGPVDGIGIQDHLINSEYPQVFYNQIDLLAKYVDNVAVTEFDFTSGFVNKAILSETVEAKELRDHMIVAYSHPQVTGFTIWGFTDNAHWRKWAPLYYKTYIPKAEALGYWNKYVKEEWTTHTGAATDENGKAHMRGHRGDYTITVEKDGVTATASLVVSDEGINTVKAVFDGNSITLTSSEEPEKPLEKDYILKNMLKQEDAELAYLQLYSNRVANVTGGSGKSFDFLAKSDNTSVCTVNEGDFVVAELDEALSKGIVEVKMVPNADLTYICKAEGRSENGEWISLGNTDSINNNTIEFDRKIDAVRFSAVGEGMIQISNIHIAKNEAIYK